MGALLFIGFNLSGVQWWIEEAVPPVKRPETYREIKQQRIPFLKKNKETKKQNKTKQNKKEGEM